MSESKNLDSLAIVSSTTCDPLVFQEKKEENPVNLKDPHWYHLKLLVGRVMKEVFSQVSQVQDFDNLARCDGGATCLHGLMSEGYPC